MDRLSAEKRLTLTYLICIIAGATSSISTGITWGHWYRTLDQCVNRNCSCILYGQHTPTIFLGGDQAPCIWVVFGPLFYVFFCLGLTCFHGYRVLFTTVSPKTTSSRAILARMEPEGSVQIHTHTQENTSLLPVTFWIIVSVLAAIFTLYSLIHFAIFLDGYYTSCNQYRRTLDKLLRVDGSVQPVIYNRLSCQAVFDFMDYMQLDTGNAYRNGIINTGLSLIIGVSTAGIGWISFAIATFLNVKLCRSSDE